MAPGGIWSRGIPAAGARVKITGAVLPLKTFSTRGLASICGTVAGALPARLVDHRGIPGLTEA